MYFKESAALAAITQKTRSEQWANGQKIVPLCVFWTEMLSRRGQVLKMFVYMTAKGIFFGHWDVPGYSALAIARLYLLTGARLGCLQSILCCTTLPLFKIPHMAQKSGWGGRSSGTIGETLTPGSHSTLCLLVNEPRLRAVFQSLRWTPTCFPRMGFICVDNAPSLGDVYLPPQKAICKLAEAIALLHRCVTLVLEQVMLPLRDGDWSSGGCKSGD